MEEPTDIIASKPRQFADSCATAATELAAAIARFDAWGVRAEQSSRLHVARSILNEQNRRAFPSDRRTADILMNALHVARDFADISLGLPPERDAQLRRELATSINQGTIGQAEQNRQPYQLQSQLWIGSVLQNANVEYERVREGGAKSPDFLVRIGTAKYGIEVKRPMSPRALRARILDGAEQLAAADLFGAVVIDLADCISDSRPDTLLERCRAIGNQIDDIVWDAVTKRPRPLFNRIIVASAIARGAFEMDPANPQRVRFVGASASSVYVTTSGNLRDHHAQWLRKSIQAGMFWAGFEVSEQRRS